MDNINSTAFFRPIWLCLGILGLKKHKVNSGWLYLIYGVLLNILITIGNPAHLLLALFSSPTQADNIRNLAIAVVCTECSLKFVIYATKLKQVRKVEHILEQLDQRIQSEEERVYFQQIRRNIYGISFTFLIVCVASSITGELYFIYKEDRGLLFPAWFPFDWHHSNLLYYLANVYQIIGLSFQLMQNYVNDLLPSGALCLLAGHIRLLSMRVSRIGYDKCTAWENEERLLLCIKDQQNLYHLLQTIQDIVSLPVLLQFVVTAFNICLAVIALMFYVHDPLGRLYYGVYAIAMPLQIFLTCYYGTDFGMLLEQLHSAAYSSNWTDQSRTYKKHLLLFIERSLKQSTALAGGMLSINLVTFLTTLKTAYSLFAVAMNLEN